MHPLAFSLVIATTLAADPTSYEAAYARAEASGKPLMVLVGADWCPGCRTLKQQTLARMQKSGKLQSVEFAVVDTDRQSRLANQLMRGNSIPQLILFTRDEEGWNRGQLTGAQGEGTVEQFMKQALAAHVSGRAKNESTVKQASNEAEGEGGQ